MKKWLLVNLVFLLATILILPWSVLADNKASDKIGIRYDGAIEKDNNMYVPVRELFHEALIQWDAKTKTAKILHQSTFIQLTVDSKEARIDKRTVELNAAPMIYKGRMYVSLQDMARHLYGSIQETDLKNLVDLYEWGYMFEKLISFQDKHFLTIPYGKYSPEDGFKIIERYGEVIAHPEVVIAFKGMYDDFRYLYHIYYIPDFNDQRGLFGQENIFLWTRYTVDKDNGNLIELQ